MAILPTSLARVSNQLRSDMSLWQITGTQAQLLKVQNQLTTGKRLNSPSDDPGDSAIAMSLQKLLEKREAYKDNLQSANSNLSQVDATLGDLSDQLLQAQQIASANVGDDATPDERAAAAVQIKSIYQQMLQLANKSFKGSYIFGGDKADQVPFEEFSGGVRFVGSETELKNDFDEHSQLSFQVNGDEVWGALSTRIEGVNDLTPTVTVDTKISDLRGTGGLGVQRGVIRLTDGATSALVDLSDMDTLGDVVTAINNAGVGSVTARINDAGNGIMLENGTNMTVEDIGAGTTASDLGILSTTPGTTITGTGVLPKMTALTPLGALNNGAGIRLTGLNITNGASSASVDLSGVVTVEDLLNSINNSTTGVRAEIKADGTGIRILNPTQGTELRVYGETAVDLGIASFHGGSPVSELNAGQGVRTVAGADFTITDSAGVSFDVDLDADDLTIQNVMDKIQSAANVAGAQVHVSLAGAGNGIGLMDQASGPGRMTLVAKNFSQAANDLGLTAPESGGYITGKDVNPVTAKGIFANMSQLIAGFENNDKQAITAAAENLDGDYQRVVRIHGEIGARVKDIETRQANLDDQNLATTQLLSDLQDTDFNEAISKFSMLQTSLQASLASTAKIANLSLMDYLG